MRLTWYPQHLDPSASAKVKEFFTKELKKHADLRERVGSFLENIAKVNDLQLLFEAEKIAPLSGGLYEMRIPPRRRGGVVRIYYCHDPVDYQTLYLLDAELKHETAPGRTDTAKKRMNEYFEYRRRNLK